MEQSTTHEIPGRKTIACHGVVFGGDTGPFKDKYTLRSAAFNRVMDAAHKMGANAVVGIAIRYHQIITSIDTRFPTISVDITGTAVTVEEK